MTDKKAHSADVLNDMRDFWWSPDFITLMAKRWRLNQVTSMLDVGCGIGHWGQMLVPHLALNATIEGIDPEATWAAKATERAQLKGLSSQTNYQLGSAEVIPYPDNYFDMVTCQTVLIHVNDPSISLKEMLRVLKPGGLLAVAEPNNLVSQLVFNNINFHEPIEDILDQVRFTIICERGREALGRGNAYRGDLIPHFFHQAGVSDIQVFMSDLADFFIPPYSTPRESATVTNICNQSHDDWLAAEAELKILYFAGGGTQLDFDYHWNSLTKIKDKMIDGYQNKVICSPGGLIMYLISGRKA